MKRLLNLGLICLVLTAASCAVRTSTEPQVSSPTTHIDPGTREVLDKINAVSAYEVPDLGLREDDNYASTAVDVEPYRHVKPHKEHFLVQTEYTGPGRAIPEPNDVATVKLGFIGPIESTVSVATGGNSHEEAYGVKMLQGARLAIEHANQQGGYLKRDIPFELVVSNDNGLWGASGNVIVDMAYKDRVWAILGSIDGANSHIAIRVALKAELPMMNSGDTDPTFIETNIPWVFRCISDDRQQGYLLTDYLYRKLKVERVGIIRSSNRYGRFGVREIIDGSRRLGKPVLLEMAYDMGTTDFSLHLERLKRERLDAVVHWGNDTEGALILNQMRDMGMEQPYFACDRCLSDEFIEIAGANADDVMCTSPWNPTSDSPRLAEFRKAFSERFGEDAETFATHAYDGMNMLIWATQVAGLNRAKIRDVLSYRSVPWEGVSGDIQLSAVNDDIGEVYLVTRKNGQWVYHSRDDLKVPRGYIPPRDRISRPPATARAN